MPEQLERSYIHETRQATRRFELALETAVNSIPDRVSFGDVQVGPARSASKGGRLPSLARFEVAFSWILAAERRRSGARVQ